MNLDEADMIKTFEDMEAKSAGGITQKEFQNAVIGEAPPDDALGEFNILFFKRFKIVRRGTARRLVVARKI